MSKLKECPLCASKANPVKWFALHPEGFGIECSNKNCNMGIYGYETKEDAIKAWQSRPLEDALKADNAKLREALTDLLSLIDEHGEATIRAHATQLLKIRNIAIAEEGLK